MATARRAHFAGGTDDWCRPTRDDRRHHNHRRASPAPRHAAASPKCSARPGGPSTPRRPDAAARSSPTGPRSTRACAATTCAQDEIVAELNERIFLAYGTIVKAADRRPRSRGPDAHPRNRRPADRVLHIVTIARARPGCASSTIEYRVVVDEMLAAPSLQVSFKVSRAPHRSDWGARLGSLCARMRGRRAPHRRDHESAAIHDIDETAALSQRVKSSVRIASDDFRRRLHLFRNLRKLASIWFKMTELRART